MVTLDCKMCKRFKKGYWCAKCNYAPIDFDELLNALEYLISEECTDTQADYREEIKTAIDVIERYRSECKYGND